MASKEQAGQNFGSSQTEPMSISERHEKRKQISKACKEHDVDALMGLADSIGGLLEDELRRSACTTTTYPLQHFQKLTLSGPILLAYPGGVNEQATTQDDNFWRRLPPHKDEEQVQRDVDRAFVYYPTSWFPLLYELGPLTDAYRRNSKGH